MHRRFYTANTLLADIEEAIDPCECRIRLLGETMPATEYISSLGAKVRAGARTSSSPSRRDRRPRGGRNWTWTRSLLPTTEGRSVSLHSRDRARADPGGSRRTVARSSGWSVPEA